MFIIVWNSNKKGLIAQCSAQQEVLREMGMFDKQLDENTDKSKIL
jgi:hypothetical protein